MVPGSDSCCELAVNLLWAIREIIRWAHHAVVAVSSRYDSQIHGKLTVNSQCELIFWGNWVSSKWAHQEIFNVISLWVWCKLTPSLGAWCLWTGCNSYDRLFLMINQITVLYSESSDGLKLHSFPPNKLNSHGVGLFSFCETPQCLFGLNMIFLGLPVDQIMSNFKGQWTEQKPAF